MVNIKQRKYYGFKYYNLTKLLVDPNVGFILDMSHVVSMVFDNDFNLYSEKDNDPTYSFDFRTKEGYVTYYIPKTYLDENDNLCYFDLEQYKEDFFKVVFEILDKIK